MLKDLFTSKCFKISNANLYKKKKNNKIRFQIWVPHDFVPSKQNRVGIFSLSAARTADVPPIGQSKSHCHGGRWDALLTLCVLCYLLLAEQKCERIKFCSVFFASVFGFFFVLLCFRFSPK